MTARTTVVESRGGSSASTIKLDCWGLALAVGVWIYCHHYEGVVHDSRLYALQALHTLNPTAFSQELFFKYGSQASFTLFPRFEAVFLNAFGLAATSWLLTVCGHVLWLAGAVFFFRKLVRNGSQLTWGMLALAGLSADYGYFLVFRYGEGFLTPRIFAEAITFFVLGLEPRRWPFSFLLAAIAAAFHPIYGATIGALIFVRLCFGDRRWLLLAPVGAAAVWLLASLGVSPFSALFQQMDPEWRSIVETRDIYAFPLAWRGLDYAGPINDCIVVLLAAVTVLRRSKAVLFSVAVVAVGGLAVSVLGDMLSNLLLIQLQTSRSLWILSATANFCLGVMACDLLRMKAGRAVLALLGVGFLLQLFPYFSVAATLIGAWYAYKLLAEAVEPPVIVQSLAYFVLVGAAVAYLCSRVFTLGQQLVLAVHAGPYWIAAVLQELSVLDGLIVLSIVCLYGGVVRRLRANLPALATFCLALGLALSMLISPFQRKVEAGDIEPLRQAIPRDSLVYWHATGALAGIEGQLIWFGLDRAPFIAPVQAAGLIFNRPTAIEFARRAHSLEPLVDGHYLRTMEEYKEAFKTMPPANINQVKRSCEQAPALEYIILDSPIPTDAVAAWSPGQSPVASRMLDLQRPEDLAAPRKYYLYSCDGLR